MTHVLAERRASLASLQSLGLVAAAEAVTVDALLDARSRFAPTTLPRQQRPIGERNRQRDDMLGTQRDVHAAL